MALNFRQKCLAVGKGNRMNISPQESFLFLLQVYVFHHHDPPCPSSLAAFNIFLKSNQRKVTGAKSHETAGESAVRQTETVSSTLGSYFTSLSSDFSICKLETIILISWNV